MKLQPYVLRLSNAQAYKDFQKKNSDAFLIAGFFVIDLETGKNLHQIDYFIPSKKKVAAFTLDKNITMQMMDMAHSKNPEKLGKEANIDLDALQGILEDEMKNRNITDEIKKIIAVLQVVNGKKVWNLNCVLSGMNILNAHVEDESETVLRMEKHSIMEYIRRMPNPPQMQNPAAAQGALPEGENSNADYMPSQVADKSSSQPQDKMQRLQQLELAIAKEKEALLKQVPVIAKPNAQSNKSEKSSSNKSAVKKKTKSR